MGPGVWVVSVAFSGWPVAVFGGAALVALGEGDALGFGVEPGGAAEVEDLGAGAEDRGDDPGFAGQAACFGGGDRLAGVEGGGGVSAEQVLQGHRDHDGGGDATGFGHSLSVASFEVLDERLAEA